MTTFCGNECGRKDCAYNMNNRKMGEQHKTALLKNTRLCLGHIQLSQEVKGLDPAWGFDRPGLSMERRRK